MKTRLSRKGVDLGEARNGGIFGMFDSLIKETCRISEDELDNMYAELLNLTENV